MPAQTIETLKSYFETGDVPTQSQFADLIDSFANLLSNNLVQGNDVEVVPDPGGVQAGAYLLSAAYNLITTGFTNNGSIILPVSATGKIMILTNNASNHALAYPAVGENFGSYGTNAPMDVWPNQTIYFIAEGDGVWTLFKTDSQDEFVKLTGVLNNAADVTPSDQDTALLLTKLMTTIDTANAVMGATTLPQPTQGKILYVVNNGGYPSAVWCPDGGAFTHSGTDGFVVLPDKACGLFICARDGFWTYFPGYSPNSTAAYKEYVANISQSSTSAPVATIISNTLGVITWGYNSAGTYQGVLTGAFSDPDKVVLLIGSVDTTLFATLYYGNSDSVLIHTTDIEDTATNGILNGTSVIIRVYN